MIILILSSCWDQQEQRWLVCEFPVAAARLHLQQLIITMETLSSLVWVITSIGRQLITLKNRYIAPIAKPYIMGMLPISLLLFIWKVLLRRNLTLGLLPGDLYYSSTSGNSSIFISAPIVSCLLVSFLLNAILRALGINQ